MTSGFSLKKQNETFKSICRHLQLQVRDTHRGHPASFRLKQQNKYMPLNILSFNSNAYPQNNREVFEMQTAERLSGYCAIQNGASPGHYLSCSGYRSPHVKKADKPHRFCTSVHRQRMSSLPKKCLQRVILQLGSQRLFYQFNPACRYTLSKLLFPNHSFACTSYILSGDCWFFCELEDSGG